MWLILLIPLLLLLVFCPTADAGVPSAINSSVPWTMYVCPQGDLLRQPLRERSRPQLRP